MKSARIQTYLENIRKTNNIYNALITTAAPETLTRFNDNSLVVVCKDNFVTTDMPTTCASKALDGYMSPFESTVTKLFKDSNSAIVGKANMDEFAMGSNNQYSYYGPVVNPSFNEKRSPGGSSGGSAAAVAAQYCDVATGTDTGGSVRLPGAYCSVLGFKPSYGLVSRYGIVSFAQSFDTVGLFAREFEPLRRAFGIINKYDPNDPTSLTNEQRSLLPTTRLGSKPLNIGVIKESIIDIDESVQAEWAASLEYLEAQGHKIHFVDVPTFKYALHTYFMLAPSEASSNLARYDGIRYGTRADQDNDADGLLYAATRTQGLGEEVRRRILLGTYNLNSTAFGDHYRKAQQVRRRLVNEFNAIFKTEHAIHPSGPTGSIDVVVHPTARTVPPLFEDIKHTDPVDDYVNDIFTVPANLTGMPAITVPTKLKGVGMQVWGQFGEDALVLDVAEQMSKRCEA